MGNNLGLKEFEANEQAKEENECRKLWELAERRWQPRDLWNFTVTLVVFFLFLFNNSKEALRQDALVFATCFVFFTVIIIALCVLLRRVDAIVKLMKKKNI
ncbi:MAG: hypothetical protein WC552_08480 [Candidatus Omnitrophota bacterium]